MPLHAQDVGDVVDAVNVKARASVRLDLDTVSVFLF